uniref:Sulfotransferase domain-containing protein n=1 Tax=Candidatus Kentrum sp. DK TaxID=2126562 RepID=A0A450T6U5_9GAMM|nr:MAG: Sulfotransferase domain-containing protein [Candidatus Kentron sp. DK]
MLFQNRRTVDFVICGTQKGGTTALHAYLRGHPEVCMADRKGVHFFDNEEYFSQGKPDYSKYHAWFSPGKSHKLLGEATPIYMYWNESPRRIWEYNPNMKLIVLLRDPIKRSYSHWNMQRLKNVENLSFWEAIKNEKERCRKALPQQHRRYSYIDRGLYLEQLRRLWAYFTKDRVLVIKSEDLKQNPGETLSRVCNFLGIGQFKSIVPKNLNSRPYLSSITKMEKDYLRSIFEPETKKLEIELNWDYSDWLG